MEKAGDRRPGLFSVFLPSGIPAENLRFIRLSLLKRINLMIDYSVYEHNK